MQDDLLHAQASVDWAAAQLQPFQLRLNAWSKANINVSIKELPPDVPNNLIVATEKEALPLSFQVEAGAYLNAIRSSLDILAVTLAQRHCPALVDDAYFPMASSYDAFTCWNYKGHKFVKALPTEIRDIIEDLAPYKGGNKTLYALHHLDIVRKHVRLLSVVIQPMRLGI